jgi:hypothetical protein
MTAKIQIRRDTSANWATAPVATLAAGEIGIDTTLNQIKIGDGSTIWTSLRFLGGTLPVFSSPATDLNDATNRVQGVYRWSGIAGISNAPSAPIDIKTADGGLNMLVLEFASNQVLQNLWTDSDGTQPQKSYSRMYDSGTWRAWVAQNVWGVSATEGVELTAKSLTLKDTGASALVVDGTTTINGPTILGNANADIVTVQAGTVSAPIITTTGDTNTGVYFPAADKIAFTAGGTAQLTLDSTAVVPQNFAVFHSGANFSGDVDLGTNNIKDVKDALEALDAIPLAQLFGYQPVSPFAYPSQSRPLLSFGNQAGTAPSPVTTFDAAAAIQWNTRFGSATVTPRLWPDNGLWIGVVFMFNSTNGLFQIKLFNEASPCSAAVGNATGNDILGSAQETTRHVWIMARIG